MKNTNYKIIAVAVATALFLNGCATIKDASSAMGSTGTGVLAGVAAGAGTGIACDKLTGGKHTAACVAAGIAVGAAVGKLAADMDEQAEKAVPAQSCSKVKERMKYGSTETKPKAALRLKDAQILVVKNGSEFTLPLEMDLVSPGENTPVNFKIDVTDGTIHNTSEKEIKQVCGGLFSLPVVIKAESEGVHNRSIKLLNADGTEIEGGSLNVCYTVGSENKCGSSAASTTVAPTKEVVKKSTRKKGSKK